MLAGLLKSPTHYSPVGDAERSASRATIVLDKMVETHAITPEERARSLRSSRQGLQGPWPQPTCNISSIGWMARHANWSVNPSRIFVVETTLDLPLDGLAANAVRSIVAKDYKQGVQQAALVSVDGAGRVRALIGGVDYGESQFNRAVDARRQAGSSWKPFVYLAAMEAGRTPDVVVVDEPVTIGNWSPHNYTNKFLGSMTIQQALAQSINTVAARLADEVGRDNVAHVAKRLGITSPINTDPAMALGTTQVSPLEMAQAYAPFDNGGNLATAYGIEQIRTDAGQVLYQHKADAKVNVIGNPPLNYMDKMMRAVIAGGTGAKAAIPGYDLAGKTGTTSDYEDAWFCGFTGGFDTVVWVGKDDNTPMRKVTGGGAPAELWKSYMVAALPHLQVQTIPVGPAPPAGVVYGDPSWRPLVKHRRQPDAGP